MILKAIWWNLVNLRRTFKKRKAVQQLRKVKDKVLFSKLMVSVDG